MYDTLLKTLMAAGLILVRNCSDCCTCDFVSSALVISNIVGKLVHLPVYIVNTSWHSNEACCKVEGSNPTTIGLYTILPPCHSIFRNPGPKIWIYEHVDSCIHVGLTIKSRKQVITEDNYCQKHILDSIGDSRIFMLLVGVDISLEEHVLMPLDLEPTSTVNEKSVFFYTVNDGVQMCKSWMRLIHFWLSSTIGLQCQLKQTAECPCNYGN